MKIESLTLDVIKLAVERELSENELVFAQSPEFVVMRTARGLVMQLTALVAAQRSLAREEHEFRIEYPATWWQMIKEQFFGWLGRHGRWLRVQRIAWKLERRFPVRMTVKTQKVVFDASVLYPKIALPGLDAHVVIDKRFSP